MWDNFVKQLKIVPKVVNKYLKSYSKELVNKVIEKVNKLATSKEARKPMAKHHKNSHRVRFFVCAFNQNMSIHQ